jgi:hypothetical protein
MPYYFGAAQSPFSFISNTPLRGGPRPCIDLKCRLRRVDRLLTFSVLYADHVLIPDPLWDVEEYADTSWMRYNLLADLTIIDSIRPLLDANLIGIAPPDFPLCAHHANEQTRWSKKLRKNLRKADSALVSKYLTDTHIRPLDKEFLIVSRPDALVEHGEIVIRDLSRSLRKKLKTRPDYIPTEREVKPILRNIFINNALDDILLHNIYSKLCGYRPLTDREVDFIVLDSINQVRQDDTLQGVIKALEHSVPVVSGIDIRKLLKLRKEESAAFEVYRDSVEKVLREVPRSSPESICEAFDDIVRPQLHQIDAAVATARKLVKRSLRESVIFGTGLVTVGSFSGIFPPDAASLLAWLGGAKYLTDLLVNANKLVSEPSEARKNDFYFLWRVHQAQKQ